MDAESQINSNTSPDWALPSWLCHALLLSVTFALYSATLYFDFVWDDNAYIGENYRIHALDWVHVKSFWTNFYLGHYAPMQHLLLAVVYSISERSPILFHLVNVLIHMAAIALLYALIKKLETGRIALVACLLYAVHPTHVETVAWISETKSTLAFVLFLISAWFYVRFRESDHWFYVLVSLVFFVLSTQTKINTVVAPAMFLLYEYRAGRSLRQVPWRAIGAFFITCVAMVFVHMRAFGGTPEMLDGIPYSPLGVRLMNFPMLLSFYVDTMVLPINLSAWEMFPVQEAFTWVVGLAWVGMALMLLLLARASRITHFWALWILVFLLPVMQIVPFPIWVADRYLYIPLAGGCVLVARLFWMVWDRAGQPSQKWALGALGTFALVSLAWATHAHLPVWRNDLSLWSATAPKCQTSAYCRSSLGMAMLANGILQRGGDELAAAVSIQPAPQFLISLGDAVTISARDYPAAIRIYNQALKDAGTPGNSKNGPRAATIYSKLARAYLLMGNLEMAQQSIKMGAAYEIRTPTLAIADTVLQWRLSNLEAARGSLAALILMAGANQDPESIINRFWPFPAETRRMLRDINPAASR